MEIILGIDFGTTNTYISYFDKNKTNLMEIKNKYYYIPSKIFIDDKNIIYYGHEINNINLNNGLLINNFKILLDCEKKIEINNKNYEPEQLIYLFLEYVKKNIDSKFQNKKIKLVFSIPSNFNDIQRTKLKNIFNKFNFQIQRIINEPTAAGFFYSIKESQIDEENILIIDIGGGTTDITLIEKDNLILEVLHTEGINLGGKDFTDIIFNNFLEENDNLELNEYDIFDIKNKCKIIKERLFYHDELFFYFKNIKYNLTKNKFKKIINKLTNNLKKLLNKFKRFEIDKILLIGGTCKLFIIKEITEELFKKNVILYENIESIVSEGCCLFNAYLNKKLNNTSEIILLDIVQLSIGLETEDGNFSVIIPRGTNLPTKKSQIYKITESDNDFIIKIFQGEDKLAKNNKLLFEIKIDEEFYFTSVLIITIEIDKNGLINMNILDKYSKFQKNIIHEYKNLIKKNKILQNNTNADSRKNKFFIKEKIKKIINNIQNNELIDNDIINQLNLKLKNIDNLNDMQLLKFKNELDNKFISFNNKNNLNKKNKKESLNEIKKELSDLIEIKRNNKNIYCNFKIIQDSIKVLNSDKLYNIKDRIKLLKNI